MNCKDSKTNNRVFGQIAASCGRRIVESVIVSGDLSPDYLKLLPSDGSSRSFTENVSALRSDAISVSRTQSHHELSLERNDDFAGDWLCTLGYNVLNALEQREYALCV